MRLFTGTLATSVAALMLGAMPLHAADLMIGIKSEPSSLDPQFHVLATNMQVAFTMFEPLVMMDAFAVPQPALAESWENVTPTEWVFNLRKDVTFSDGSPFTAEDVLFSFDRVAKVPNSPSAYTLFTRQIESVEAIDDYTVKMTTFKPYPLLAADITSVVIMSHLAAAGDAPEGKTTTELNRGDGLIGTGPFTFVSWQKGADFVVERNPNYWGDAPEWDTVTMRPMTNAAARAAALLAGDIAVMEDPPTANLSDFENNPDLTIAKAPAGRVVYIALDQQDRESPGISGTDTNPLMDARVREALFISIDRYGIVDRVMGGLAEPAGDLVPAHFLGSSPDHATAPTVDVERAKALLTEAGYPDGFSIVLGSPNGRYVNDVRIAQTIASMWSRVGVTTEVEASAPPVFFQNRDEMKYSAYLGAWGNGSGENLTTLNALINTYDREQGKGTANGGRYSNPEVDALLAEAASTMDDAARGAILSQADSMVLNDFGIIPVHYEVPVWALRNGLTMEGRADQYTLPQYIVSAE
ncbi:ABC transporter substrate-binding protein [Devosia sp. Root685]|uniref:ABC transporter substrate-binding protein n=1 Tax=Devosia sp. Root685 TaxID=1736587 RepID=UPI000B2EC18E|nr:ABC transporter substrate-binding protein [Devosia sp. Root685]